MNLTPKELTDLIKETEASTRATVEAEHQIRIKTITEAGKKGYPIIHPEPKPSFPENVFNIHHALATKIITELAAAGFPTPEETYGFDIEWAVKDALQALQNVKSEATSASRVLKQVREALGTQPGEDITIHAAQISKIASNFQECDMALHTAKDRIKQLELKVGFECSAADAAMAKIKELEAELSTKSAGWNLPQRGQCVRIVKTTEDAGFHRTKIKVGEYFRIYDSSNYMTQLCGPALTPEGHWKVEPAFLVQLADGSFVNLPIQCIEPA